MWYAVATIDQDAAVECSNRALGFDSSTQPRQTSAKEAGGIQARVVGVRFFSPCSLGAWAEGQWCFPPIVRSCFPVARSVLIHPSPLACASEGSSWGRTRGEPPPLALRYAQQCPCSDADICHTNCVRSTSLGAGVLCLYDD